jgi:hypothetical protein
MLLSDRKFFQGVKLPDRISPQLGLRPDAGASLRAPGSAVTDSNIHLDPTLKILGSVLLLAHSTFCLIAMVKNGRLNACTLHTMGGTSSLVLKDALMERPCMHIV